MSKEIVVVDKDDTLMRSKKTFGWQFGVRRIFDGAAEFLARQAACDRRCVVASHGIGSLREDLAVLEGLFEGYYGRELLDGTHEDKIRIYRNPNNPGWAFPKDLYLLRQLLADSDETRAELKMALVGDPVDLNNAAGSDPETPMVAVDNKGKWLQRRTADALLDFLLKNEESPSAIFDAANASGRPVELPLERSILKDMHKPVDILMAVRQKLVRVGDSEFIFLRGVSDAWLNLRAIIENTDEALMASTGSA